MFESTTVANPVQSCDSLARWLDEETKRLGVKEAEILRTKRGEELDVALSEIADEFENLREAKKSLQERRIAAEQEYL